MLIFSNRSMYMSLLTGKNTPNFAKDTVYRFMKMVQINWMRFTTILASRIINNAILPRLNVTVLKRQGFLQRSMTTQNINIASDLEYLLLDGQIGVHFCRQTAFFFLQKTKRIVSMKRLSQTKEPLVTGAESCLWKREPMPCLHFWKPFTFLFSSCHNKRPPMIYILSQKTLLLLAIYRKSFTHSSEVI